MTPASVMKNIARMDVIAVLLLVAGCLLDQALLVGRGIENPWISMTGPWCPLHTVNPLLGYAYMTDWGAQAFIGRAAMDGSEFTKLITTGIVWPNALTIDYYANRVYWADAFLDTIE